jgi:SsrA-binding protein
MKIVAQNKKAFFEYEILDRLEAGIALTGDEVKSVRAGHVSLIGSFAHNREGEIYLVNCNITPYAKAFMKDPDAATRSRKLLLHKKQINKLIGDISKKGITIVPLKIYLSDKGLIKVELGIAKHKKAAGKKQALKEKDIKRQTERELKDKYRY